MDKQSFASVYRTAAILAAFSRTDPSGDEPSRDEGANSVAHRAAKLRWRNAIARLLRRSGRRAAFALPMPLRLQDRHGFDPNPDPDRRWMSQRSMAGPAPPAVLHERALVSHFAFCDDPDPHHPGMVL